MFIFSTVRRCFSRKLLVGDLSCYVWVSRVCCLVWIVLDFIIDVVISCVCCHFICILAGCLFLSLSSTTLHTLALLNKYIGLQKVNGRYESHHPVIFRTNYNMYLMHHYQQEF